MLRDIDLNKKQTDSNFIKSLPSHPGKEFEIKKDKLRNIKRFNKKNNNNNNDNNNNNNDNNDGGDSGGDLFSPSTNTAKIKIIHLSLKRLLLTISSICCPKSMIWNKS